MRAQQLSIDVSPELVSEIRDYFRHEADKTYSDEAILAAINWWVDTRLENMYEEIGEVILSPHLAESQHFREILEAPEMARAKAPAAVAPVPEVITSESGASIF